MNSTFLIVWAFLFVFPIFVALVFLQLYICKKGKRLFGLLLPAITFLLSLAAVVSVFFSAQWEFLQIWPIALLNFVLYNVPTAAFLIIYISFSRKWKKKRMLEKMNIQDL